MVNALNISFNLNPKRVKINRSPVVLKSASDTRNKEANPGLIPGPAEEIIMFSYSWSFIL